MISILSEHLLLEEDERLEPYKDHLGFWTIGVGHLIDSRKGGKLPIWIRSFPITQQQSRQMLTDDIHSVYTEMIREIDFWEKLSKTRQVVLMSMAFQLGVRGLLKFKKMLLDLELGLYGKAAGEMLQSHWANQTPGRALRLSDAMRTDDESFLVRLT